MDPRFNDIVTDPQNQIFQVVFFPDRIYHAQYLNATRSPRYRYNVQEVRGKADINVLKGEVYFDGLKMCNFLRLEYRGARLAETAREKGRFLGRDVMAYVALGPDRNLAAEATVRMHHCPWVDAFQVECWETLEPPPGKRHDYQVLDLMGFRGSITRVPQFDVALRDTRAVRQLRLAFRENEAQYPSGAWLPDQEVTWDNFFQRNIQVPNRREPNSDENTISQDNYGIDFRRGWFIREVRSDVQPVRYANGMMEAANPAYRPPADGVAQNVIEMRWILQQEFGGTVVFFHEVTIPPRTFEGVHQHIGSEELYYIVEGTGIAYMGENDDPNLANAPTVDQHVYGIGTKPVRQVEVRPGSVIYTKSGGIHGIKNESEKQALRFVAFLYHST
jgi:mannose-6-phosphate isomerase-like protein (cupin superfamily)